MSKKRIGILTGGGDVPPLNAVIAAACDAANKNGSELIGFCRGWQGVMQNDYVMLNSIELNPLIGGTVLKSSRINLKVTPHGVETALQNLGSLGLDGLIVIGGEDTLSNAFAMPAFPQVLISKTIDNDVGAIPFENGNLDLDSIINYFTLGHPTAAEKIAAFVSLREGLRTTAYSHERIIVVESMGMHAGWLSLASSMGHPDFIIIPEFPLNYEIFVDKVIQLYREQRHAIIVIAEGARWDDGIHLSADESEKDEFGHPRFRGAAEMLAKRLKEDLKTYFNTRNVNAVNPSYLYRSGKPNRLDFEYAQLLGKEAVSILCRGNNEPVLLALQRKDSIFRIQQVTLRTIGDMDTFHRFVDERFYNPETLNATSLAREYLSAIIREISIEQIYGKLIN